MKEWPQDSGVVIAPREKAGEVVGVRAGASIFECAQEATEKDVGNDGKGERRHPLRTPADHREACVGLTARLDAAVVGLTDRTL